MRHKPSGKAAALALAVAVGAGSAITVSATWPGRSAERAAGVRNVIFLLGDGMGRSHVTAARERYYGAAGALNMERLPFTGSVSTYSVERGGSHPSLVTDSAGAATAWSSGVKTYNAAIGVDARGRTVATLMEQAKAAGFATGNVTTAEVTDATPAAQYSHALLRGCQGPVYSAAACLPKQPNGSHQELPRDTTLVTPIAEQIARNGTADVVFGGGLARFEPDDQKALEAGGYQVLGSFGNPSQPAQTLRSQRVATRADLDRTTAGKVVGLFSRGTMTLEQAKAGLPAAAPQRREPTLAQLTRKSIALLAHHPRSKGFFLQVEGAQIDKRSHANDAGQTLAEVKAFDDAVKSAVDFARKDGHTLVVVTADHESGGLSIIEKGTFTNAEAAAGPANSDASNPANNSKPVRSAAGNVKDPARSSGIINGSGARGAKNFGPATFRTPDDPPGVRDGSPRASLWLSYLSGNHTGADVPLFAYGPDGQPFATTQNNTDLYRKMYRALFQRLPHRP